MGHSVAGLKLLEAGPAVPRSVAGSRRPKHAGPSPGQTWFSSPAGLQHNLLLAVSQTLRQRAKGKPERGQGGLDTRGTYPVPCGAKAPLPCFLMTSVGIWVWKVLFRTSSLVESHISEIRSACRARVAHAGSWLCRQMQILDSAANR